MMHQWTKGTAAAAALAATAALSGCNYAMTMSDSDGVPLAELDMSGPAPTNLALAGPDRVLVSDGERLDIEVSGNAEAAELLRFSLEDGTLAIGRARGDTRSTGMALVQVTMPSPSGISLAGSGDVKAASLSGNRTEANIAGSGRLEVARVYADNLDLNIMGSGYFAGSGTVERLELSIAGSGAAKARGLQVGSADVSIAGSGDGEFSSDGRVDGNIAGSGNVIVHGTARCSVSKAGSGKAICRNDGPARAAGRSDADAASTE